MIVSCVFSLLFSVRFSGTFFAMRQAPRHRLGEQHLELFLLALAVVICTGSRLLLALGAVAVAVRGLQH